MFCENARKLQRYLEYNYVKEYRVELRRKTRKNLFTYVG